MKEFEERLTTALSMSQNSQQLCTQYHKQAKKIMLQCKEQGRKLTQAESSLHSLQISFIDQLEVLETIFTNVQRKFSTLEQQVMIHVSHQKKIYSNLANIFRKLEKKQVDPGLSSTNGSLYHFVDTDSVTALRQDLESVLGHLAQKKNSAQLAVGELQVRLREIHQMVGLLVKDKCFLNGILRWTQTEAENNIEIGESESLGSRFVEFHYHYMDADLSSITSILVAISSLTDRIASAKSRYLRTGEEELLEFQLQSMESQIDQVPDSVAKASDCLNRMQKHFGNLSKQCSLSATPFLRCNEITKRLEEVVFTIEAANNKLQIFERNYQELGGNVSYYCTELENLGLWYELYNTGYTELLFEIQRREQEDKRQKRLIEIMETELSRMHEEEMLKRQQFIEEHGRYLPTSLFPNMEEPAVQYSLSADIKPSPLPQLSRVYQRKSCNEVVSQLASQHQPETELEESVLL
eukprot:CAMPEP_0117025504 /NCGR_PEP_ID=MMETSP0472-20121206/18829_1 /TAXON_ID=693140 ORGANISM="Tiarina fusus, Strain LIS" /NCGR_SAMPLE_ID=MMETSP0472 /ASSEMBLY_ACC=CAM_ASM_000603 /LENGTH=465 /DNA_ID=CAMNT_0004732229 /DNA_START=65 /DNA_END=1462 /DNA_ORIENTATION=+